MRIAVDYGRSGLEIQVPDRNLKAILGLQPAPPLSDPEQAVRRAIANPVASPSLSELARGRSNACILVCDITRPVPNELILAPVLSQLEAAGIPRTKVLILVATGLHRASTSAEIREMLGDSIASNYRVESHDARDNAGQVFLGETSGGVPVSIDRRYAEADLKITTGLIEPHMMAGFSGGRKVICPGVVGVETIRHFHGVSILQSPLATVGKVEGNPVHQLALEVALRAGCDFIINVALDDERRVTGVFAGDMDQAWLAGVEHVRAIAQAPLAEAVDIVITSAAGYPLDSTFYQSIKGLVGAMPAVKPGGTIILLASMKEGVGSPEFTSLLETYARIENLMESIHQPGFFCIDQWGAQELGHVSRKAEVMVYSGDLPSEIISRSLVNAASSPEHALSIALARHGEHASVAVIPRGPYVIPVVGDGNS